ncbi:MAG TPA: asparagine synthetase B [Pyrinomonadaceae bacterium]|nr:asparagine synthetase B [Pyrinomonadaceae bacterium]
MCGFIGRINGQPEHRLVPPLTASLQFLGRRGPDSHRDWMSQAGNVELLHARLAIVDTDSRAHQPFTDEARGITVALNGEIYNYRELRSQLSGYSFRTESDTEVIIALYLEKGLEALKQLRGMFALCIVDENKRLVYLSRDPIGKKPLFLAQWSGNCYFGSSVLALVAASGCNPAISDTAREEYWEHGHVAPNHSLIQDCRPVRPGEVVELDWQGIERATHSCIPTVTSKSTTDLKGAQEYVTELIQQSVRRRLLNNPNPVALLSGGIDSTVVTKHMKAVAGGSAITLGSVIPGTQDERFAREAAQRLQVPLQTVRARSANLAADVNWALNLQDEPLGMISFFPLALLIRAAKEYGRILLTGDGGDEVFLGYGQPEDWIKQSSNGSKPEHDGSLPHWMSDWGKRTVTTSLVGHMFTKLDRAAAEQGVEARCPLLDWDVVAFARTLSPDVLFCNGRTKGLLKAELGEWPTRFVNRRKIGFAYNLRWAWYVSRFEGLREMVSRDAVDLFASQLPSELRSEPSRWKSLAIFRNFPTVWKLVAWSSFEDRLRAASSMSHRLEDRSQPRAALVGY